MKKLNKKFIFLVLIGIMLGFIIGFYYGEKIYLYAITPLRNTNGEFDYSIFWSALSGVATAFIGGVAIWQTKKSNDINERVTEMERKDRKTFVTIDVEKTLDIYYVNKDPILINKIDNKNIHFDADYIEDTLHTSDILVIEFNILNISTNYATSIYFNNFEIEPEFEEKVAKALSCDSSNSYLLKPNQSQKAFLIVTGLHTFLNKEPIDFVGDMCNFKFEIGVDNLNGDKTTLLIELFAEQSSFNAKLGMKSFKVSLNDFKVIN